MKQEHECDWLLLVPTEFELEKLKPHLGKPFESPNIKMETCGFGPIAAAARTAGLLHTHQPANVLLVGIAGAYTHDREPLCTVGMAYEFGTTHCFGIGAGSAEEFKTAAEMGWNHWNQADGPISDSVLFNESPHQLITVCAASSSREDVMLRIRRFPEAAAEDMEAFGVAMACRLANHHGLRVVRGISNVAGQRDKSTWRIEEAIKAAAQLATSILKCSS